MNTSKYDSSTRQKMKLDQRSPAYRELQRRAAEERLRLETKLRARNAAIELLKKKLVEFGVDAADLAEIAA